MYNISIALYCTKEMLNMLKVLCKVLYYSFVSVLIAEKFTTEIHDSYAMIWFLLLGFLSYELIKNDEEFKHE